MTDRQKIATVESQMRGILAGDLSSMKCPYCEGEVGRPSMVMVDRNRICCPDFGLAAMAVIKKIEIQEHDDQIRRVQDAVSRN